MDKNCITGNRTDMKAIKMAAARMLPLIGAVIFPLRAVDQRGGVLDVATVLPIQQATAPTGSVTADDAISEAVIIDQVNYTCTLKQVAKAVKHVNISDKPGFTVADSEAKVSPNLQESQACQHEADAAAAMYALATAQTVVVAGTGAEFIEACKTARKNCRVYAGTPAMITNRTNFYNVICAIPAIKTALSDAGISVTVGMSELKSNDVDQMLAVKVASVIGMPVLIGEDTIQCQDKDGGAVTLTCWAPAGTITVDGTQYNKNAVCFVAPIPSMMDVLDESTKPVVGFTGMYDDSPANVDLPSDLGSFDASRAYAAAMINQFTQINSQPDIMKGGGINKYVGLVYRDIILANADAVTAIAGADKIDLGLSA